MLEKDLHTRLFILQPTPFCNLDCQYCYLPDRQNKSRMPLEIVRRSFEQLFSSGFVKDRVAIVWHCGEPLAAGISYFREAFDILKSTAKKLGLENSYTKGIQTNGLLINDNWCKLLKAENVSVGISIDGPNFIHDRQRVTRKNLTTHHAVIKALKKLKEYKIDVNIICVLTDFSLDYVHEIHDFFSKCGVDIVGFNMDEIEGTNQRSSFSHTVEISERFRKFMEELYEIVEKSNAFLVREFEYVKGLVLETRDLEHGEPRPFSIISVDYQGNFSTFSPELLTMKSTTYGNFQLGNVCNMSFLESFQSDKFQRLNKDIQTGVILCEKNCDYYSLCGGGSASNKYFEKGNFQCDETLYCRFMKKMIADVVLEKMEERLS